MAKATYRGVKAKVLFRAATLDAIALGGVASVLYGLASIYPPAAFIAGGLAAVAASVVVARGAR